MLLSQAARDTHSELLDRWMALDAWLTDSANAGPVAKVSKSIDVFRQHWHEVDKGLLSDSDQVCGAYLDLETAETTAMGVGYPKPAKHGVFRPESCSVQAAHETVATVGNAAVPGAGSAALAATTYCEQHPDDAVCRATAPQDRTWCQRAGAPNFVCSDWFPYALGGMGLLMVAGVGYATYRAGKFALPFAVAAYMPGALPAVLAHEEGGYQAARPHILKAVAEESARRRSRS